MYIIFSFPENAPCGGVKDAVVEEVGQKPIQFESVDAATGYIPQLAHPIGHSVIHQIFDLEKGETIKKLKVTVQLLD